MKELSEGQIEVLKKAKMCSKDTAGLAGINQYTVYCHRIACANGCTNQEVHEQFISLTKV